jgi:hypothetical protein
MMIRERKLDIEVLGMYGKVDVNDDELKDKAMCWGKGRRRR